MFAGLLVASLGFIASTQAAITILYPTTDTIWYKNNTVSLNWTTTAPDSDTYFFRALLSNQDQSVLSGNHSIADSTNATANFVRILLPSLTDAQGYVVNFVNTSDEAQVFATSQSFEIADGAVSTSTAAETGTASSASSSTVEIPNASTQSSSNNPFATTASATTTSKSSGVKGTSPGISTIFVKGGTAMIVIALGMSLML